MAHPTQEEFRKAVMALALTPDLNAFSIICNDCDAGNEITSAEHAIKAGWTNITYDPSLPSANYVGHCPACPPETPIPIITDTSPCTGEDDGNPSCEADRRNSGLLK